MFGKSYHEIFKLKKRIKIMLLGLDKKIANFVWDKFLPIKAPDYMKTQSGSLSELLPYESSLLDDGREVVILSDGSLGTLWRMQPVSHEILPLDQLERQVSAISESFSMVTSNDVSFQILFSSRPSKEFKKPSYFTRSKTFAQKVMTNRMKMIEKQAKSKQNRLKKIDIYLTLRVETSQRLGLDDTNVHISFAEIESMTHLIENSLANLREFSDLIEKHFESKAKLPLIRCSQGELVKLLRDKFHSESYKQSSKFCTEDPSKAVSERISDQVLNGNVEWSSDGIAVGEDLVECISWGAQPNKRYLGMMSELLKAELPIDCVVNIRPNNQVNDLAFLADQLKGAGDSKRERQRKEVYETEDRIVYGEKLLGVSFHIFIRNVGLALDSDRALRKGTSFAREFTNNCLPVFVEEYAALPVFMSSLPFAYSKKVSGFIRRERRVLSSSLGSYLPVLAGSIGTPSFGQIMQSRSGEALWLDHRATEKNPHTTVLGSSGGGKSFYVANYLTSEFAKDPDAMVFIIDSITSYKYLAKAIGEDHGAEYIKPPKSYPNIFKGEITKERLPAIVSVIRVAVELISKEEVTASELVLLSDSILKTYRDNSKFAKKVYVSSNDPQKLGRYVDANGRFRVPRLSDVIDAFNFICDEKRIDPAVAASLRTKLLPLFGSGPYAAIFDKLDYQTDAKKSPGITLIDNGQISNDPVLSTITSLIMVTEIQRQIDSPLNAGRKGIFLIEEAGQNLKGDSPELVEFVKKAFATFRKKEVVCKVVTNDPEHFNLPALKSARAISGNEVILPMDPDAVTLMKNMYGGTGMFREPFYYDLIGSLLKKNGEYSEILYLGESFKGTFTYTPTGYDYWLAANKEADSYNIDLVAKAFGSFQKAVKFLAENYPAGVRKNDLLTKLTEKDIQSHVSIRTFERQGATAFPNNREPRNIRGDFSCEGESL